LEYDRLIEQLKEKLKDKQDWELQKKRLEYQLQQRSAEWKDKIDGLEARSFEREGGLDAEAREAVRAVEERVRGEADVLRAEIEAARHGARRDHEGRRSLLDGERDQLEKELLAASEALRSLQLSQENNIEDMERLKLSTERVENESMGLDDDIFRLEESNQKAQDQLNGFDGAVDTQEIGALELKIRQQQLVIEDLRKEYADAEALRDRNQSDVEHMKKANDNRSKEAIDLRRTCESLRSELTALKVELQNEKTFDARASIVSRNFPRMSTTQSIRSGDPALQLNLLSDRQNLMDRFSVTEKPPLERRSSATNQVTEVIEVDIEESDTEASELYSGRGSIRH
jgi:hypothetical protein